MDRAGGVKGKELGAFLLNSALKTWRCLYSNPHWKIEETGWQKVKYWCLLSELSNRS